MNHNRATLLYFDLDFVAIASLRYLLDMHFIHQYQKLLGSGNYTKTIAFSHWAAYHQPEMASKGSFEGGLH